MCALDSGVYFAVLLADVDVDGPGHPPVVEQDFMLLRAGSEQCARDAAAAFARCEQYSSRNACGQLVRGRYREVATVYEVWPCSPQLTERLVER